MTLDCCWGTASLKQWYAAAGLLEIAMRQLVSAILTLFLVMDPIGNTPLFMVYLKDVKDERRGRVVARESVFALLILLAFLLLGPTLMSLLGITRESLYISGGVLLFLIAVGMIFPGGAHFGVHADDLSEGEPFIVPLAVPLVAGPSTMATIMIFASQPKPLWIWLAALVVAWGLTTTILMLAPGFSRLLGRRGLRACERLMGMVLTVLAVQMFIDGVLGIHRLLAQKP
jgi:multiple antibiotic resistance protein